MLLWFVTDENNRDLMLSGMIHFAGDENSKRLGYRQAVIWIKDKGEGWIEAVKSADASIPSSVYSLIYHP